jgi:hypothetical protein
MRISRPAAKKLDAFILLLYQLLVAISSALIGFSLPDQFHKMAYLESGYSRP